MIGKNFSRFYPQEDVDRGRPEAELRIASEQGRTEIERWRVRKDGSHFWSNLVITAARSPSGTLLGFFEISHDITERAEKDAKCRGLLEAAPDAMVVVDQAGEIVLLNLRAEKQFGYLSDELVGQPVKRILPEDTGKLDSDADVFIAHAVDACNRIQQMIRDLLTYAGAGTRPMGLRTISSEVALHAAIANLGVTIGASGAMVSHDPLPTVITDNAQLTQVFQNLIGNAIKYRGSEAPRIHISARTDGGNERIFSVRDNGLGIDAQYFDRIFVPFQRLHGRGEFAGTGIGLSICKKILERLGGRTWVEPKLDHGSTFHYSLPHEGVLN